MVSTSSQLMGSHSYSAGDTRAACRADVEVHCSNGEASCQQAVQSTLAELDIAGPQELSAEAPHSVAHELSGDGDDNELLAAANPAPTPAVMYNRRHGRYITVAQDSQPVISRRRALSM